MIEKEIVIRQMRESELELLLKWSNDPRVIPFWYGKKLTLKDLEDDWTSEYFDENDESGRCFIIEYLGESIGMINHNGREDDGSFEIDIIIGEPGHWSKGLGTRVLKMFIDFLFHDLKATRIFVVTGSSNPRAIKAYQKAGFRRGDMSLLIRDPMDSTEDTYLSIEFKE
jgi:RimJ/RimL family protein N-acetyltransferase